MPEMVSFISCHICSTTVEPFCKSVKKTYYCVLWWPLSWFAALAWHNKQLFLTVTESPPLLIEAKWRFKSLSAQIVSINLFNSVLVNTLPTEYEFHTHCIYFAEIKDWKERVGATCDFHGTLTTFFFISVFYWCLQRWIEFRLKSKK